MKTLLLAFAVFLTPAARAEIPRDLLGSQIQTPEAFNVEGDGAIRVLSVLGSRSLYSEGQVLEVEVANLGAKKEFYFYDLNEIYGFERDRPGYYLDRPQDLTYFDGAVVYLGPGRDGYDRFAVNLLSVRRTGQPVEIYLKMAGRQMGARVTFPR